MLIDALEPNLTITNPGELNTHVAVLSSWNLNTNEQLNSSGRFNDWA